MATALTETPGAAGSPSQSEEGLAALRRSLTSEMALLGELAAQLADQRAALAADDTATLEAVIQQIGRTLLTLREARRQRGLLMELVSGEPGIGLRQLVESVRGPQAVAFGAQCQALHQAAVSAGRELAINQSAIRRAIETGERYLHALLTLPGFGQLDEPTPSGLLLNQRA